MKKFLYVPLVTLIFMNHAFSLTRNMDHLSRTKVTNNKYFQATSSRTSSAVRPESTVRNSSTKNTIKRTPPNRPRSTQVGMYFMPSWELTINVDGKNKTVNWFWGCLKESWITDCLFTNNPAWGVHNGKTGRDYTGETRPDMSNKAPLRGFYKPNDPKVIKEQIAEMKNHGVDYLIYDWFWGRHYYHDLSLYYPTAWQTSMANTVYGLNEDRRAGISENGLLRVKVPGMELHADQLHVIVNTLSDLRAQDRIKFSLMWVDDSYAGWLKWLSTGQIGSGTLDQLPPWNIAQNMPSEKHSKDLFLRVHEKMVNLWYDQYFSKSFYLRDEKARPIVYHMYADNTMAWASAYGLTLRDLIATANKVADSKKLPRIKFIFVGGENGSNDATEIQNGYGVKTKWIPNNTDHTKWFMGGKDSGFISRQEYTKKIIQNGYEGLGAYTYYTYTDQNNVLSLNTSFDLMLKNYQANWKYWKDLFKNESSFEFHTPTALGWDMTPAGGYNYDLSGKPTFPQMDIGYLPTDKYRSLLKAASESKYVTLCCWNEYMEGNILEPQKGTGFKYLEVIKDVFSAPAKPKIRVPVRKTSIPRQVAPGRGRSKSIR